MTPHKPQTLPKINIQGMSIRHWRSSERKIDIRGRPVTTKRLAETIWKPATGNSSIMVRIARGANSIIAVLPSGVKTLTSWTVKSCAMSNPATQIMAFGSAQFLLQFIMSGVQLLMNKTMGWYGVAALGVANGGDVALSGMNINGSILMLILMPVFGINQGAQPILGYNYGAKQFKRVLRAYLGAVAAATLICVTGFAIAQLFTVQLVRVFTPDGSAAMMLFAPRAMRTMMLLLPVAGFQIVSANLFVVTGRPRMSIFLSLLRQCLILIPCILIFGRTWGLWGVIAATPVADALSFVITGIMILFELRKLRATGKGGATIQTV
jgi:Na+-driven multidrug efflux pump